jgi:ketosteroid isomerase-like protein
MAPREEIEAAIEQYLELRRAAITGERPWSDLAEVFTDDIVFVDPVWGRHEGRDHVVQFLRDSMAGLDDWDFPHLWQMIDGDKVVLGFTNRLPGRRPDGGHWDVESVSVLDYAGDGRFLREADFFSESNLYAQLAQCGWRPPSTMNPPPADRVW